MNYVYGLEPGNTTPSLAYRRGASCASLGLEIPEKALCASEGGSGGRAENLRAFRVGYEVEQPAIFNRFEQARKSGMEDARRGYYYKPGALDPKPGESRIAASYRAGFLAERGLQRAFLAAHDAVVRVWREGVTESGMIASSHVAAFSAAMVALEATDPKAILALPLIQVATPNRQAWGA